MTEYPQWYRIPQVKFQIRNYTYRRETMFIKPKHSMKPGMTTRMIKIHNVQHLDIWLKSMHITSNERDYNLYYSLAHYEDGIPNGSLKLGDRDFGNWTEEHWKSMDGFDFLLDIDAGNHNEIDFAYYSAIEVKKIFDKLEVPYHLRFSGMGFHFVIPYVYFSDKSLALSFNPEAENNIYDFYRDIALKFYDGNSEMVDTGIYDSRRVVKIPYSLALYPGRTYVCYPFKAFEFETFDLEYMRPRHFINKIVNEPEPPFHPNRKVFKLHNEFKIKK